MERLQTVLAAIRQGQVDVKIIDLAGELLHEGAAPDYRDVLSATAAANPKPELRASVNDILQEYLAYHEKRRRSKVKKAPIRSRVR
jgi:hypothetical protein